MKNPSRSWNRILTLFLLGFVAPVVFGQGIEGDAQKKKAIKFDEFGSVGRCELRDRMNRFLIALSNKPDHQGYVINYGTNLEIAARERGITDSIAFRNFDRARITLIRGGFRTEQGTELWLVPPGADNPTPSGSVDYEEVSETSDQPVENSTHILEKKLLEFYRGGLDEFVLDSIKQREAAEIAELNRRHAEIFGSDDEDDDGDHPKPAASHETQLAVARGSEASDESRLPWNDVGIARFVSNHKGTAAVIIFYADNERYDINKLRRFVEQGRDFLVQQARLAKTRLTVEYGGYRESPETEHWFVPRTGKAPVATPEERCKETKE